MQIALTLVLEHALQRTKYYQRNYEMSHCWYYLFHAAPAPADMLNIINSYTHEITVAIPKKYKKVSDKTTFINGLILSIREELLLHLKRYKEVRDEYKHMPYSLIIDSQKQLRLNRCTALSLKHNHMSYCRGQLNYLENLKKELHAK